MCPALLVEGRAEPVFGFTGMLEAPLTNHWSLVGVDDARFIRAWNQRRHHPCWMVPPLTRASRCAARRISLVDEFEGFGPASPFALQTSGTRPCFLT